jgi:hypothetical protein
MRKGFEQKGTEVTKWGNGKWMGSAESDGVVDLTGLGENKRANPNRVRWQELRKKLAVLSLELVLEPNDYLTTWKGSRRTPKKPKSQIFKL